MELHNTPLVLVILDGWGLSEHKEGNAIARADLPNIESFLAAYPHSQVITSGEAVGLPEGQMGNSEVGHLNIGAGRVVYQELTRVTRDILNGSFFKNEILLDAVNHAKKHSTSLHFMGLLSDGGVHSHIDHLFALLELAARRDLSRVFVHAFLDGRDVSPDNAREYLRPLGEKFAEHGFGAVATVMGRYYAMDRDKRWERTGRAYNAMVFGEGIRAAGPEEAVELGYARGETDEFIHPTVIVRETGEPVALVSENDSVIFFNFRPDRARQITRAFVDRDFAGFARRPGFPRVHFTCLTSYDVTIEAPVAFKPQTLHNTFGEILGENAIPQLRLAETEKYAHVTFFFNGGVEKPNPAEERVLIPSPRVATYDLKPEMSAYEVTGTFLEQLELDKFKVIIMNYANADMVGHTGNMTATISAVKAVDDCLGRLVRAVLDRDGTVLITADHGNAEEMREDNGHPHTAHTTNPTPLILIRRDTGGISLRDGRLADIAPTMLELLGLPRPAEMTGKSLIVW